MWWQEEQIDRNTIYEFFSECQQYTKNLLELIPDLRNTKFNHQLSAVQHPFDPIGAIIHSTHTESVPETLRLLSRRVYGTHFIVTEKPPTPSTGKLLSQMPAIILMPMGYTEAVPHAGYISKRTWGIDIRNIGILRPWNKNNHQITPVYPGEEYPAMFQSQAEFDSDLIFYWRKNMWRELFEGSVTKYSGMYFEQPNSNQILGLAALLHILDQFKSLDREMIIPSNCIHGFKPKLPMLPISAIRTYVEEPTMNRLKTIEQGLIAKHYKREFNISNIDETFINENLLHNRWRASLDDGELNFVISGPDANVDSADRNQLCQLGYSTCDPSIALRMFAINCGVPIDYFLDAISQIPKKMKIFRGEV